MSLYLLWLICFSAYANTLAWHGSKLFDGSHPFNGTRPPLAGVVHAISLVSSMLLEAYSVRREWLQHEEEKDTRSNWYSSWNSEQCFWNSLQQLTHAFFWIVIIMNIIVWSNTGKRDPDEHGNVTMNGRGSSGTNEGTTFIDLLRVVTAFSIILMWIGWLHWFRGYGPTALIIRMFTSIYYDLPQFIVVVLVQVVGFALAFRLIYSGYKEDFQTCELTDDGGSIGMCDEVQTGYDSLSRSLFTAFLTGFLG